jgi:hypothetical protein
VDLIATPQALNLASISPLTPGQVEPVSGVSGYAQTVESPRVDNDTSESPQVINSQPDKPDASTGGQLTAEQRERLNAMSLDEVISALADV